MLLRSTAASASASETRASASERRAPLLLGLHVLLAHALRERLAAGIQRLQLAPGGVQAALGRLIVARYGLRLLAQACPARPSTR